MENEDFSQCEVPDDEIKQDIEITQSEIEDKEKIKEILMKNPHENKLKIYLLEGEISQRKDFIAKLNRILEYRQHAEAING